MTGSIDRLIHALEVSGCEPRSAGPGIWFAQCPTCKLAGRHAFIEIRKPGVICCIAAHEAPAPPRRRAA